MKRQRIGAGTEIVDRGSVRGVAVAERAVRHHRALRAAQRPAQVVAVVARVRRQAVEIYARAFVQGERVGVALPARVDRAVGFRVQLQRGRRVVDDLVHIEGVGETAGVLRGPDPALDDQRVAATDRGDDSLRAGDRSTAVEPRRAGDLTSVRIEQPPRDPVAVVRAQRGHVEREPLAGTGVEAVQIGFVGRVQRRAGRLAERELGRGRGIEHAERIGTGRRAVGAHPQLVRSGQHQLHGGIRRAVLPRFAVVETAVGDFHATRAGQGPAETAVVVRREAVDQYQRGLVDREHVVVDFARRRDRPAGGSADRQVRAGEFRQRRIPLQEHAETVVDGARFPGPAFEQQVVATGQHQRRRRAVLEIFRSEQLPAGGIEQPPVGAAGRQRQAVEHDLVTGGGIESVDRGRVARVQRARDLLVERDRLGLRQRGEQERELRRGVAAGVDGQRVGAGDQFEQRVGTVLGGIRIHEGTRGHLDAARSAECPVEPVAAVVGAGVEQQRARLGQRERVMHALTGMRDLAFDERAGCQGIAQVLHVVDDEAEILQVRGIVDPAFQRDHVLAVEGGGEHIAVGEGARLAGQHAVAQRIEHPDGKAALRACDRVEEEALPGGGGEAVEAGFGWRRQQRAVVALRREVGHRRPVRLVHAPVTDQAGLAAAEQLVVARRDLRTRARHVPDPHLVDQADEALLGAFASTDAEVVAPVDVAERARSFVGVHQRAVGVGAHGTVVVGHRDVRPLIERRHVTGIDPGPARVRIREGPADRAVRETRDLVLALLVDDDAAPGTPGTGRGRAYPGLDRERRTHAQRGAIAHAQRPAGTVQHQRAVGLALRVDQRRTRVGKGVRKVQAAVGQRAAHLGPRHERLRHREVEHAEAEVTARIADAVDRERVGARCQPQQRIAAYVRTVRLVEATPRNLGSQRPDQRPRHRAVGQGIEQQHAVLADRELVRLPLPRHRDGAAHALADRDRGRPGRVLDLVQRQAVARRTRGVAPALDQQRVGAVQRQRRQFTVLAGVVHLARREHQTVQRIEQAPVHIATGTTGHVEEEPVAGAADEAVDPRLVGGIERLLLRHAVGEFVALAQVEQPEAVVTGRILGAVDGKQVLAGFEVEHRIRIEIDRIGLAQRAGRDHRPTRPAQRPVDPVGVGQRVENHPRGVVEREGVAIGFAGDIERAVHARDHEGGQRIRGEQHALLHRLEQQAVAYGWALGSGRRGWAPQTFVQEFGECTGPADVSLAARGVESTHDAVPFVFCGCDNLPQMHEQCVTVRSNFLQFCASHIISNEHASATGGGATKRASGAPASAASTSPRSTQIASSISVASSTSASLATWATQPIISDEGNGHGWLTT
ncbi:MAG: hypothetical protein CALGDGBN_01935 [Pseudomonadales bacterium]|nr:hypothetical protein [Pseudomonadales bacterium]